MKPSLLNEEEIIENIKKGIDVEQGFRWIVSTYKERVYWHIRGIVGTHEDATDILQNTFVKVYKNVRSFQQEARLFTWLYRIATNESLNHLKKNKKFRSEELGVNLSLHEAETHVDGEEIQQLLQKALETLPHKQRLVFNMKYFDEMTYDQISEILETSVGALKASFHHAKKKIEAFIKVNSYD